MIRGLLWLPLLALFTGLAWAGWNEYRKLEAYKVWAEQFERAKYDIYAALGQQGDILTWGLPTRQGVVEANRLNLTDVDGLALEVNNKAVGAEVATVDELPKRGRVSLGFTLRDGRHLSVPFTDREMAFQWMDFFRREWSL